MRIDNAHLVDGPNGCELRADVRCQTHWVWGDEPFPVWYRFPAGYREWLNAENGDPFFAAFLAPAMALGESLEIEVPVSERLLQAGDQIQSIYRCWDRRCSQVDVQAPRRTGEALRVQDRQRGEGLFFSMGVDSAYCLLKSTRGRPSCPAAISHLIVVEGFDVYLWEDGRFPPLLASVERVADAFGKRVLPVTTNLREFSDRSVDWVKAYYGAALASVALALGGLFPTVRIAAAQTYERLLPGGAHPLLDPLWGTESTCFVHDGLEARRLDKIGFIAQSAALVENLRVCTTAELTDAYNCGRCEKCLRTMIGLHIAGALQQCRTLPHEIDARLVRELRVGSEVARQTLAELLAALGDSPEDLAIQEALQACLVRNRPAVAPCGA